MRFRRGKSRKLAGASSLAASRDGAPLIAKRRRGIYLLPNFFTLAALFSGFLAIVQAMNQRFEWSAILIFAAMVLDGMDGRVARLTNTQTAFGEQFDSLSDMTSFGVAPALVMYEWILKDLGRWGMGAAFVYCACAAARLARFNANISVVDKRFFQGLPSPAAAALLGGFVWLAIDNRFVIRDASMPWVAFVLTLYAGGSMVSNAPFLSGKSFALAKSVPFWVMFVLIMALFFVFTNPPVALFAMFCCYALSGWLYWFWQRWRGDTNPAKPEPVVKATIAK